MLEDIPIEGGLLYRSPTEPSHGFAMRSVATIARIGLLAAILVGCGHAAPLRADLIVEVDELPQGFFLPVERTPDTISEKVPEVDQALDSFKRGRFDECLERLEAAAGKHANLLPPRLILAKLFLASKRIPQGRAVLEQAATAHPGRPEIYLQFAALALAEGRLTDASLQFEKALSLAPDEAGTEPQRQFLIECHAGLATVAERRGQWPTAQKHVSVWLEADPSSSLAHERLARAMVAQDRPEEAYQTLKHAAKLAETPRPPELMMGILLTQLGKADLAEAWIVRAAEQSTANARTQQAIAAWHLEQGQPEKAEQHAHSAAKLDPKVTDLTLLRGTIARHLRHYEAAEEYFQEHHTAFPADIRASNQLALVLIEQADRDKHLRAVQLAEINARQYPRSAEALATLGWVYFKVGRLAEAEKALQAATAGGQSSSDTAYYLARVLAGRGRLERVTELLQSAIETPGPFVFREEAQRWLAQLRAKVSTKEVP